MDNLSIISSSSGESCQLPPYSIRDTEEGSITYRPPTYEESEGALRYLLREVQFRAISHEVGQRMGQRQCKHLATAITVSTLAGLCGGFILYRGIEQNEKALIITGLTISSLALALGVVTCVISYPTSEVTAPSFLRRDPSLSLFLEEEAPPRELPRELSESPPPSY